VGRICLPEEMNKGGWHYGEGWLVELLDRFEIWSLNATKKSRLQSQSWAF